MKFEKYRNVYRWVWVWVNSGRWWWTGRPGVRFMGSQRVRHNWATELNWAENCLRVSQHWSNLPHVSLHTHTQTQRRHFHLENGSLHPQAGAGLTPCTLGLQGSLWEDVNSVPSLPQKRLTGDLLDPWSRAWRPGSVREAEGKPCRAGAETSPRTEAGSPEHSRQSSPLGCWDEIGVGGKHVQCSYQPWLFCGNHQWVVLR